MSHKLNLEFIQTPLYSLSRFSWVSLLMLMAGLGAAVYTWQIYQTEQEAYATLELKLYQLNQHHPKKLPVKQVVVAITPEKLKQLQETVNTLAIPWGDLFLAIEQSDQKDVALLGFEPSSQKQQVILRGEAKSLQAVLDYIQQLQKQAVLSSVYLQNHSIDEANISKPVSFTIFANWKIANQ